MLTTGQEVAVYGVEESAEGDRCVSIAAWKI